MSKFGEIIYAVAKAINGPHYAMQPGDPIDLDEARNRRWLALSVQQKREMLQKARAAFAQIEANTTRAIPLEKPTVERKPDADDM